MYAHFLYIILCLFDNYPLWVKTAVMRRIHANTRKNEKHFWVKHKSAWWIFHKSWRKIRHNLRFNNPYIDVLIIYCKFQLTTEFTNLMKSYRSLLKQTGFQWPFGHTDNNWGLTTYLLSIRRKRYLDKMKIKKKIRLNFGSVFSIAFFVAHNAMATLFSFDFLTLQFAVYLIQWNTIA